MSTQAPAAKRPAGPGGGPMHGMFGPPPSKSKDFRGSLKRLLRELGAERKIMSLVFVLITTSVVIGSFGPKILGRATNYVFYGFLGRRMPAGVSKAQAIAGLRTKGENRLADMLQKSSVIPGKGIDFHAVYHVLILAIGLYVVSSLFMWIQGYLMAGITQRTVFVCAALPRRNLAVCH
jgi:ATP-binding cassette subfamily B multidrug efflux pump